MKIILNKMFRLIYSVLCSLMELNGSCKDLQDALGMPVSVQPAARTSGTCAMLYVGMLLQLKLR